MAATRVEVIAAISSVREELERIVSSAGEDGWSHEAYEGWTAKQLLCHIASTSGVAGFLLAMAANPGASFGGAVDNDAFNAQQVAARQSKPVDEIVVEARTHLEEDAKRVAAASDELLNRHYTAPWGIEGRVADVIVDSLQDHLRMHIRDLGAALQ